MSANPLDGGRVGGPRRYRVGEMPDPARRPRLTLVHDTGGARAADGGLDVDGYVDGALSPGAAAAVGRRLAREPGEAARAVAYRAQIDGLHALYDPVLAEPIPDTLLRSLNRERGRRRSIRRWRLSAAAVLAALAGAGAFRLLGLG
ncbi:MAG TPA: hypothetical protein VEB20_20505 [Azospirillaceae bacterium]|nr:hypothetical protein [Azospirillaceae bacterium]